MASPLNEHAQVRRGKAIARKSALSHVLTRRAAKVAFSAAVVALAFAGTYASAPNTFAVNDVLGISFLALAANSVLLAPVLFFRFRLIANALAAGAVLLGALTMYVVHTSMYRGEWFLLGTLSIVVYASLLVAYKAIDDHPWIGAVLAMVASLSIGAVLLRGSSTAPSTLPAASFELPDVSFSEKPNVYFLGFGGITPAALLGRFGTDTTSFHDLMSDRFRTFRNFFSNHEHTRASYNMMLSLADGGVRKPDKDIPFFSGTHDVPLFRIFRRNGYEITTIAMDHYMGKERGPYIDNYVVTNSESICTKLGRPVAAVSFYGYCSIRPLFDPIWPIQRAEASQRIVENMLQRSKFRRPQLVLAHVFLPMHAWAGFDMEKQSDMTQFTAFYLANTEIAAGLLAQVVDHLQENDPSAVLFVFGDHGPWLTKSLNREENWPLAITDRQATAAGVFPPQRCSAHLDPPSDRTAKYLTTLDVVYGIIRCLSEDDHLAKEFERTEWALIRGGVRLRYGDFLYE